MRKTILALAGVLALSACTTTEQDVSVGTAAGALIGGVAGGWKGAAIGAAVGAGGGLLVRNLRNGYCQYRDPDTGRIYTRRCN
ncbi:YMGG-like glycine zipper-containing protein [Mesorhizobium retamae]|uniref:YMGG-like glycine zipper-containing protein n=1 Tax=Mesorhizobium retamae TaxID=2912854 RepID=A0ABS9QAX1_9HYPH|nr:YMGG-like glycine zipper-containing protein [Mesorhizobium sp. IRAMC:0171]MCG7504566.1 YMGG-like glycine zipper-containing protein [Mesorhizobium sp. IRAMC:0171]